MKEFLAGYWRMMVTIFVFLTFFRACTCHAETINLSWDPPPAGDRAIAYHVYKTLTPGKDYEGINSVRMPATGCVITLPDDGKTYYLIVKAFNGTVESPAGTWNIDQLGANGVELAITTTYIPPPAKPANLKAVKVP